MTYYICQNLLNITQAGACPQGWHGVATATLKMSFATLVATQNQSNGIECSESGAKIMELRDFD